MARSGEQMRAEVLAILRRQGRPMSAYDVQAALAPAHPKIAPPTVYRALSALMAGGVVHRLESLNAFMACRCAEHADAAIMSICDECGVVEETVAPDLLNDLSNRAEKSGFHSTRHVVEIHGVCASCHDGSAPS
ncbi:MAG: Fur family transcriptional regulator [Pseudomonadota bacterium]